MLAHNSVYNLLGPIGKLNNNIDDRLLLSLAISAGCTIGDLGVGGLTINQSWVCAR